MVAVSLKKNNSHNYNTALSPSIANTFTNTTIITIVNPDQYSAEVETIGTKFGEKQHRKELITAIGAGDCKE